MAALPYMQLYVADYLADTAHLNAQQHGAYLLLLFNYWQRGKPLKNSNERLANVARMSIDEWGKNKDLIAEFFTVTDDEWIHERIERDLDAVNSKSKKAKQAGKASAAKRLSERSTNAEQTLNHTDTDTDTDTDNNTDTNVSVIRNEKSIPDCPHQEIINLYKKNCPESIHPRTWDGARANALKARWREKPERQCLEWWGRFFDYIHESDFLMGRQQALNRDPFQISLDWIVTKGNFDKIIDGKYENRRCINH